MAAENEWPKIDGDIAYASEYNDMLRNDIIAGNNAGVDVTYAINTTLAASTYFVFGDDITINNSITVDTNSANNCIIFVATGTITVTGTLDANSRGSAGGANGASGSAGTDGWHTVGGDGGDNIFSGGSRGAGGGYTNNWDDENAGDVSVAVRNLSKFTFLQHSFFSTIIRDYLLMKGAGGGGGEDGAGTGGAGGQGGGAIFLIAPNITISGTVTANAADGSDAAGGTPSAGGGGGGGGGAGIIGILCTNDLDLTGATLNAAGGDGGDGQDGSTRGGDGGDGGAGGIIFYTYENLTGSPTTDVGGGAAGAAGGGVAGNPGATGTNGEVISFKWRND